jgi:hypothetical protein
MKIGHDRTQRERPMADETNALPGSREALEAEYGKVWDAAEFSEDFEVVASNSFLVVVRRRSDGKRGSLFYQERPRFYFFWRPASPRFYFG